MSNHPASLVSVIVPVYNGERFLLEALDSVVRQALRPMEIIVIDDGSTDGTAALLKRYAAASDVPIHYVYQENQGPAAARNRGLELAAGEFIAFLDADDVWLPDKLLKQIIYLREHQDVSGVICHAEILLELGAAWPASRNSVHYAQNPPAVIPSALIVRKQVFDVVGTFDATYFTGEDSDWFFRAHDAGVQIRPVPDVLLRRRFHHTNLSHSSKASNQNLLKIVRASIMRKQAGNV